MKIQNLIILVFLLPIELYSQCNVKVEQHEIDSTKFTSYQFEQEKIHYMQDWDSDGNLYFMEYSAMISLADFGLSVQKMSLGIGCLNMYLEKPTLARKITFYASNNKFLTLISARYEKKIDNPAEKTYVYWFYFDLENDQILWLLKKEVSHAIITDERTNKSLLIKPYKKLFSNQISCVYNKWMTGKKTGFLESK